MSHDEIPLSHTNDCDRPRFDVTEFYERKRKWSLETFGPAQNTHGVVAHLRKEVKELRAALGDEDAIREELADICLLAIDLSWRGEGEASDMGRRFSDAIPPSTAAEYIGMHMDRIESGDMPARSGAVILFDIAFRALGCDPAPILEKFEELQTRTWPDWRTVPADQPIEHVREVEAPAAPGPWCANCGDAFDDPERERPCPRPSPGKAYVDCGRGGHMFTREIDAEPISPMVNLDAARQRCMDQLRTAKEWERNAIHARLKEIDKVQEALALIEPPPVCTNAAPTNEVEESWPARIERVATESLSVEGQIAHLRAEVDGLRLLDESNRLEMERIHAALHAKKDETTSVAAARVWSELLAAEGRGRAAQLFVAQRDEERKRATSVIDAVRSLVSAPDGVYTVEAVRRLVDLSNDRGRRIAELDERYLSLYPRTVEILGGADGEHATDVAKRVVAELDALRASNEADARERNHVRKLVDADPSETLIQAVRRYVMRADEQEVATLVAERDRQSKRGDDFLDMLRNIRAALGDGEGWTAAALVERAGQLRDDSVAYRSLRGRLVGMLGCSGDFTEKDLLDLIADRINGPITDAEDDLLEQVQQLEGDVTTLKAALHVATRAVQS